MDFIKSITLEMKFIHLLQAWGLFWISLCIFSSSGEDKSHVCQKSRLIKHSDVPQGSKAQICEELNYLEYVCKRIRPASLGLLKDIYSVEVEEVCCPGWMPIAESDDDDFEDGDEEELECQLPCKEGFFGEDCSFECRCIHGTSYNCNPVDGSCDCLDGWMGRDCDERCSPGYFGPNCEERSIFSCMNGGINHPVTGHCLCESGYDGARCEIVCEGTDVSCGVFACENCVQDGTTGCDYVSGFCHCRNGWKGRYCSEPCDSGFEEDCSNTCCSGHGHCNDEMCICGNGYHGNECQYKCEEGTFGRNCEGRCLCPFGCNHVTGVCEECPPGFTGERCTDFCPATRWGPSCNHTCSCQEGKICDIFTGECFLNDQTGLYLLSGSSGIAVLAVVIIFGVLSALCKRHKKRHNAVAQNDQTYIDSVRHTTEDSNTGYLSVSETSIYSVPLDVIPPSPLNRDESISSDGYLTPIRYYTIQEVVPSAKPVSNG